MLKIKYTLLFLLSIFVISSCGDSVESTESTESVEFGEMSMDYSVIETYFSNGDGVYNIIEGSETSEMVFSVDGETKNIVDDEWEAPDILSGEYDSYEISEINNNSISILSKSFDSEMKLKINWLFKCTYKEGTYEDFLSGKMVKIEINPDDEKSFQRTNNKASTYVLCNVIGFDPMKTTSTYEMLPGSMVISKDTIIVKRREKLSFNFWVDPELRESMVESMISN